jgi:hypothetical protein
MYISTIDQNNITSFIQGFETGSNNRDLTELLRKYLEEKLKVNYSSDGWPGQIRRYSDSKCISWTNAFKHVCLEVIANDGGFDNEMQKAIKTKLLGLIDSVQDDGDPWFNMSWIEEWHSLFDTKSSWLQKLWTDDQYKILCNIDAEIKGGKVFEDGKPLRPAKALSDLCNLYRQINIR